MKDAERFKCPPDGHLTAAMKAAYQRDGFLVLEGFCDDSQLAALRTSIDHLVDTFDPATVKTIFSTGDREHAADRYFQESGDKIRFFLEAAAFDDDGDYIDGKDHKLNKIGHNLHDLNADFDAFFRQPRLEALAGDLGISEPGLVQSMIIFKQPRIGGEVGMHQDASFLYTEPVSVTGFWFALDDADETNGCLIALPGGHRGVLKERFHYQEGALVMDQLASAEWPAEECVALTASKGTLVVLHGLLPHGSAPNLSDRSRQAVTLHVVDKSAKWLDDNWLKRADSMPVRGFH